ncbi:MAG TPA: GntR family transcriptional regulator [Burkholderiales bacterium]
MNDRLPAFALASRPQAPLYHQVYTILRTQLMEGRFTPDKALPGELELAEKFQVSRVTMRRALDELVREGLIERSRGRGSFARPRPGGAGRESGGLLDNLVSMTLKTTVRVVSMERMAAPDEVVPQMGLAAGSQVLKTVRIRSVEAGPISLTTTFVPEEMARGFSMRTLGQKPMLTLLEEAGVAVARAEQSMSACLADATTAPLLEVGFGAPLMAVNRVVFDTKGRAVQLLRGLYRPDRYEYRMTLTREARKPNQRGDSARIWVSES